MSSFSQTHREILLIYIKGLVLFRSNFKTLVVILVSFICLLDLLVTKSKQKSIKKMILINNIRKSSNATSNADLLITNLNKLVSPISLSTFNLRRQQPQQQNEAVVNTANLTNSTQTTTTTTTTNDKSNSKYLLPSTNNAHNKRKRVLCDQYTHELNNNNNKKKLIDYELIKTCEKSSELVNKAAKKQKLSVATTKAKTTRNNFNSQVLVRSKRTSSTSTMASKASTSHNNCISYTQFSVNLEGNKQQHHKSTRSSLCENISVLKKAKNTLLTSKYNFKPSKKQSSKMVFGSQDKTAASQKVSSKSHPFSFLQNPSPSSSLSASLASLLKRQIGKSSLTMNSTEIDSMDEMKKSSLVMMDFQHQKKKTFGPEAYQSENNSAYSNCSTCYKSDSANCTYCEHCAANANESTNYDTWMLNSTNFLSSTPANLNDSMFMVKEEKRPRRSSSRVHKKSSKARKASSVKDSQIEAACSTLLMSNAPLKVKKVTKSSSGKSKISGAVGKDKLVPRTSSSAKLGGLPATLKFDYKRHQKRTNLILPTASSSSANSNDNFTNFGDFLVWYV
jgi:hypothetical protein